MPYPFQLPELGYAHDALEPHIDARTMEIHHGKHHAGYTAKFNAALEPHADIGPHVLDELVDPSEVFDSVPKGLAKRRSVGRSVWAWGGGGNVARGLARGRPRSAVVKAAERVP